MLVVKVWDPRMESPNFINDFLALAKTTFMGF